MTESIPGTRRSRRALAAKVAGLVGMVICALIIVVVWLGRGAIAGTIESLAGDVDGGFERAITATDAVGGRLDDAAANIQSISADATELASTASPSPERLAGLQARLGQLGDRYRELRTRYAEVKENVTAAGATLRSIGRFVPGVQVPEAPTGVLADLDEKLRAIDDALTSAWDTIQAASPGKAAAEAVAERATALEGVISSAADAVHGVSANLATAQANAANTIDGVRTILLIATLAITGLLLWVLLLNVALWLLGRAWQRESDAAGVAAAPPSA